MVMLLVISAVLAVAGCATLVVLGRSYVAKPGPAAAMDSVQVRPALVHFVTTNCKPGTPAYEATIVDLAARGFLSVSAHPAGLWLAYTEAGAATAGATPLAAYEQGVLDSMHGRLKNTGGAPLAVLAEACRVDVEGTWTPFEGKLREEARKRGLCRWRLPLTGRFSTVAGITSVAVATFAAALIQTRPHADIRGAIFAGFFTWLVFSAVLTLASLRDRLTPLGAMIAAAWARDRAALAATAASWAQAGTDALQRRAFAVALGIPGATTGPPSRPGKVERPSETTKPAEAWSSFTGDWRLVKIENTSGMGMAGGVILLVFAGIFGLITFAVVATTGLGPWPLGLASVAGGLGLGGVLNVIKYSAIPRRLTFDGQVIARWLTESDSESSSSRVPTFAIDDGVKAWTFGSSSTPQLALEDLVRVRVTVNPRDGSLIDLTVIARQRPETVA